MEIDIELNITLSAELERFLIGRAAGTFELRAFREGRKFGLRRTGIAFEGLTINGAIQSYLGALGQIGEALSKCEGLLRVGVYVQSAEAAALSVDLSASTLQHLAKYGLSLEVNCYPCSAA